MPVGSYPDGASPYGVMDMAGNVMEWVNDWFQIGYYGKSPYDNPPGAESGTEKVLRGGYWSFENVGLQVAQRFFAFDNLRWPTIGFRCVQNVLP